MTTSRRGRPDFRVRAKVHCRCGADHDLCVAVDREVHPDLRCPQQQSDGYTYGGGGGGCALPRNLADLVERELRENYQESRRRWWVTVAA